MSSLRNHQVFLVKSTEKVPCPCCGASLKVIGSRPRKYREETGAVKTLIIRRLFCDPCRKIHHELPDLLIPYKRYRASCVEKVVSHPRTHDVAADNTTLIRWNHWFLSRAGYWMGALRSISFRYQPEKAPLDSASADSMTVLERLGRIFGNGAGWLSRMTKPIVNAHLWEQTRSAFPSG